MRAKTPSGTRRRVSYPVSDSISCIRRANAHGTENLFHDVPAHRIQLNRIQVGAVLREKTARRADDLDGGAHRRTPMHRQIIQHDGVAGAQRRCEHVFDVGEEAHAIDRTVEDGGGREAGHAQGGESGRRVPAAVGGVVDHALAPLPTPVAANQVGPHATFIQKHEPRGIPGRGGLLPRRPGFCHVRTGVFGRVHCFFKAEAALRDRSPDRREARRRRQRLL